jgi:tetratricopeptide (TPR) repeat protein
MPSSARSSRILSPHDTEASKEPSIVDASGLLSPAASDINSVEDDDEAEFEQEFLSILKELAYYNMTSNNYEKAVKFLHQAIARHEETKAGGQDYRNLRAQLALCYILQHQWQLAEPLVMELHETSDEEEMTIWILFHALALGYLSEYAFDNALAACKLALKGKKALCKSRKADWGQYHETLALSSTILEVKGDYIRAEVFRRRLPADFKYSHPKNGALFIEAQKELLLPSMRGQMQALRREEGLTRLQDNTDGAQGQLRNRSFWETTGVEQESDLTTKLSLHEKQELDTTKECIVDEHPFESDSDTEVAPIDAVHLPSIDQSAENKTMSSPVSVPIPKQKIDMAYGNSHADFIIQVDFDSKYPVETGTPHSSVPLGAAPWSSRFHKKSKTLLRKRRVGTEKVHPSKLGQCSCGQIIPGFDSRGDGEGESAGEMSSNDSSSSCETVVNAGRAARSNRKKVLSGSPNFVILGKLWWRRKVMRRDTKDDDAGQRIIAWMRAQQSHDNAICKPSHMPAESELDSRSLGIWPIARRSCATPERPDGPDGRAMRFEMDPECVTELWDTSSPAVVDSIAFSPMGISPMESLVEHPGDDGQLQKEGNQLLNIDGPVGALLKMRPLGSPTGVLTKPSMLQESLGRMVTAVISIETPQEQVAMKRKQDALVALLLELKFLSCDESLFSDLRREISWISEEIRLIEGQSEDEAGGTSTVATTGEAVLVAKLLVPSIGEHGNNCSNDLYQGPERFDEDSVVIFRPS